MSSDTDQSAMKGSAITGGLSAMWGLVLDHLVDKHAQAVAATRVNPEGGVVRTPDGVVVTSKELYLQVLLNADDNYTNAGYQKRMEQSFGPIFLGMDWTPDYVKESTPTNAAIGRVTRRDAFEVTLKEARTALPSVPAPGGIVDIQALSDIVLAKVCSHYFDIPDAVYVKAGGFGISNLVSPAVCPADYTPPSAYIFHPDPDPLPLLEHFAPLDERREQQFGERAVVEEQLPQLFAVDRDVAHRLGHDGGEEDGLPGEQVHLA